MPLSRLNQSSAGDTKVWCADAEEAAVDTYMAGVLVEEIVALVGRSPNAVIWKLWTLAGMRTDLRAQMLARGDARPLRYADIRIRKVAFRWVLVHLRSAVGSWIDVGQVVTLEAIAKQAENSLLLWEGRASLALELELTVAHWLFDRPTLWHPSASSNYAVEDGTGFAGDDSA